MDHSAEGTATVYQFQGDSVLRFEDDTDIQNGPDLWVYVLPTDDYAKGDDLGDFINLGKIKGNVGGQNYELPAEYDPAIHQFVMIWCLRFDVPFAASPLA
ncbi:MAG: DM13 domain-containing protein [Acidimicrobiia bacterium]|nr:DM13 domain-containing protein [Acidimicrobiia bacterium]